MTTKQVRTGIENRLGGNSKKIMLISKRYGEIKRKKLKWTVPIGKI